MSEVDGRNIRALAQAAQADRSNHDALASRLRNLEGVVTMQSQAIAAMQQQLAVILASRGSGPTAH